MNLTKFNIDELVQLEFDATPACIKEWQSADKIKSNLRVYVEGELKYLHSDEIAQRNFDYCKVAGTKPEDYKYRIIELASGGHVMTSFRAMGGDMSKPFILIVFKDFVIDNAAKAKSIAEEIAPHYKIFNPRWVSFYESGEHTSNLVADDQIRSDYDFWVGHLQTIQASPMPAKADAVEVRPLEDMEFYDTYAAMYKEYMDEYPEMDETIQLESFETMDALVQAGTAFEVLIDGHWAGIIAAEYQSTADKYLNGYCMMEEMLDKAFRGEGYAAAMQRQMLNVLPSKEGDLIFGHINAINHPSYKTAQKVGRQKLGGFHLVSLK